MSLVIDVQYPNFHHVAHRYDVVRTFNIAVGHLADMDQTAILQADVHEGAEIDDVENGALEFHARLQVLDAEDAFLEHRGRQIFARIPAGPSQTFQNVAQCGHTHLQPARRFLDIDGI